MADLVVIPENVRAPSGQPVQTGLVTQNIGPGNTIYAINATHVDLASANNAITAAVKGVTVDSAFTGQPISYVSGGTMNIGNAAIPVGAVLVLSNNAGMICNEGDISTNHYLTVVGFGPDAANVQLAFTPTGIQHA